MSNSTAPGGARLIERTLVRAEADVAASECAETLGLSRVVARKYLECFVLTGQAAVTLRSGQTGRPQRRYGWAAPTARGRHESLADR
ncbi:MAG TPA: hypothetical protein VLO31_08775 [Cryobacterium sp.]|nr:hypothetical protein [Cryobacterium sp.]